MGTLMVCSATARFSTVHLILCFLCLFTAASCNTLVTFSHQTSASAWTWTLLQIRPTLSHLRLWDHPVRCGTLLETARNADSGGRGNKSGDGELIIISSCQNNNTNPSLPAILILLINDRSLTNIPDPSVELPGQTLHCQDRNKDSCKGRGVLCAYVLQHWCHNNRIMDSHYSLDLEAMSN